MQESQAPSESCLVSTVVLDSPLAACISAWLQKYSSVTTGRALPEMLAGFEAQLDDARWLGRWLREEARLAVSGNDAMAWGEAFRDAMKRVEPSEHEQWALNQLLMQLERGSASQSPQFACAAPLALVHADSVA